jgi:hypothetical protein
LRRPPTLWTGRTKSRPARREAEHKLEPGHRQQAQPRDEDKVLLQRLYAVPQPRPVHSLDEAVEAQEHHRKSRRAPAGLRSGQESGERAGFRRGLREEGRHRGDGLADGQGLRHAQIPRYVGLQKTQLHHLLSAAALNFVGVGEWLMGMPRAKTRRSPFARLIASPAPA